MTDLKSGLTRKEIFSGSFVLFVGLFFLVTSLAPVFQNRQAVPFSAATTAFLKPFFYAVLNLAGSLLLFLRKKPGWAICTGSMFASALLPIIVIFGSFPVMLSAELLLPLMFVVLAVLALLFMFDRTVRKNQRVNNLDYLITFFGYIVFFSVYFFL